MSGVTKTIPISSITILRETRQRREVDNIEELAESIHRIGLLHYPTVTEDYVLVAGERRITACKMLGWTSITVTIREGLDEFEQHVLELEENVRRQDLSWQDQTLAIKRYHDLQKSQAPAWTLEDTGASLGFSHAHVQRNIVVAEAIEAGNDRIKDADKFSVALGVAMRDKERKQSSDLSTIAAAFKPAPPANSSDEKPTLNNEETAATHAAPDAPTVPIKLADFAEWQAGYMGTKFNMLHCDFPYGVNMQSSDQGAGAAFGTYHDSPDVYFALLRVLEKAMTNVVAESAHMIFWFSMDFYQVTLDALTSMGWKVSPFPLIWYKSDNTGILPDAKRGPRRIYETAFFCSRGDRLLAAGETGGAVGNVFAAAGRGKTLHMNEKPVEMLKHFMRMTVDDYSIVLDPTCGSGNALKAAEALSAAHVLGLEINEEFYNRSVEGYYET